MKKKDLPGWCPFGSEKCPFGLACRFSGSHEDGFAPDDEDEAIALFEAPVANPRDDMNDVTNDVKYALARRTFDFSRADGILKAMGLRTSDEVRGGGDNNTNNNRKNNDGKNQHQQKYKRMKTSENEKRVIAENADEYSDDDDDGNNNTTTTTLLLNQLLIKKTKTKRHPSINCSSRKRRRRLISRTSYTWHR
jgi:hypothetical protein